ncbi:SpoIIE family protein phosphatase [Desulfobacterales bacterium HSG2]|nr:SpoIIE family protein phosphatase [Desulfobacterales bacterium HSG2]
MKLRLSKYVRNGRFFVLGIALILCILSGIIMHHNIRRINQGLAGRLEHALKLAEITLPQAVWQFNEEYADNFVSALFSEESVVYAQVQVRIPPVRKELALRTRSIFEGKPFFFFRESAHFVTGTRDISYDGEKSGTVFIAVSREGIYRKLALNTLPPIVLMSAVIIVIAFYYIRLKRSEKKYRNLHDNAIEAIFQTTREGRVISANPHMVRILGFASPEELISSVTNAGEQLYANRGDREEIARLMEENDDHVSGFETRFFRKDRSILWVSISARAIRDKTGRIIRYEGWFADITSIREKERAEREREIAEALNQKIMESIQYASLIQSALLPTLEDIKMHLPESFLLWMPRDIVGGDIIFFAEYPSAGSERRCNDFLLAVIDCTGHGVPGALLTMLACSELKRITGDDECRDPGEILRRLNASVKTLLRQQKQGGSSNEGMDAAVCFISPRESVIRFAGAGLPLICVRNGELKSIKGDRRSIGYRRTDINFVFTSHTVDIAEGISFYMATDGFEDQLGEHTGSRFGVKRFSKKRFGELIRTHSDLSFREQRELLFNAYEAHRGGMERQDDVTVVGFGFK